MTNLTGVITEARIYGVEMFPVWVNGRYILPITLSFINDLPDMCKKQLPYFVVGYTKHEAECNCQKIRKKFLKNQIFEASKVYIFFNKRGYIRAIRAKKNRHWMDIRDNLLAKTSKELNIDFRSLAVC